MLRVWTLTLASLFALGARAELVNYVDLEAVAQRSEVADFEAQLSAAVAARDTDRLLALARSLEHNDFALLVREHLLEATAKQLALAPVTPQLHVWLQHQSQHEVQVRVAHRHAGHTTPLPAYDPAAAARYALARHVERAASLRIAADLSRGLGLAQAMDNTRAGKATSPATTASTAQIYAQAIKQLDTNTLAHEIDTLSAHLKRHPELGAAIIEAAKRLQQPSVLADVIAHGHARDARAALSVAAGIDPAFDTLPLIRAAIARPDTAASGLNALARAALDDPALSTQLLDYLHQPRVAHAAAAAIAAYPRPELIPGIARALHATNDVQLGTALTLTLSLMQHPQARAALRSWSEQRGTLNPLRDKIRKAYGGEPP